MKVYQHNYPVFEDRVIKDCVFVFLKACFGCFSQILRDTVSEGRIKDQSFSPNTSNKWCYFNFFPNIS